MFQSRTPLIVVCSVAMPALVASCFSLDGFSGGVDGGMDGSAAADRDAVTSQGARGDGGTWCSTPDAGFGHLACFDFDESNDASDGWTNSFGAVTEDPGGSTSPPRSAYMTLGNNDADTDGGSEERLLRRFDRAVGALRLAFDLRADSLPATRGYAFATVGFYGSPVAKFPDRSISLSLSSTYASLTERLREDGSVTEHPMQRGIGADGSFHHVEISIAFSSDAGGGTASVTIDGQAALSDEPLTVVTAEVSVGVHVGLYTFQSPVVAVAAHYDSVTMDITAP